MLKLLCCLFSFTAIAQAPQSLEQYSLKLNQSLPEVYDAVTKLRQTTVENNQMVYHFLVHATLSESSWALPKVKNQVLSSVCQNAHQKNILQNLQAGIIYRYENIKGQSLGEFLISPAHCSSR